MGRVPMPKNTVPHMAMASMFAKLAAMHARKALANDPDPANAGLPRPDKAVEDVAGGRLLGRTPVIGTPTPF